MSPLVSTSGPLGLIAVWIRRNLGQVQPWLKFFKSQWTPDVFLCSVSSQDGPNPTTTFLPSRKVSQTFRTETERVTRPTYASSFQSSKGVPNCVGHSMAVITSSSMWGHAKHGGALWRWGGKPRHTPSHLLAICMVEHWEVGLVCPQSKQLALSVPVSFVTTSPFSLCQVCPLPLKLTFNHQIPFINK